MSGVRNLKDRSSAVDVESVIAPDRARMRNAALVAAVAGTSVIVGSAFAGGTGTFTTSSSAPSTNILLSQPDDSGTGTNGSNLLSYVDFTNQNNGVGESFVATQNETIQAITFQGGGNAGGSLSGNWNFVLGQINLGAGQAQNWWGSTQYAVLDTEVGAGTPIANDVSNGIKTNYDTFTLANPVKVTAGQLYFFNFDTLGLGGWYGMARSATGNVIQAADDSIAQNMNLGAISLSGNGSGVSSPTSGLSWQYQNYDRTFFLQGTVLTSTSPHWAINGNGAWETDANWSSGQAPGVGGDSVYFDSDGGVVTVSPTITLSSAVTVDPITFNTSAGSGYTILGSGTLNSGVSGTSSTINVLSGSHTISANLNITNNYSTYPAATFNLNPGTSLTSTNTSGGAYGSININGGGTATTPGGSLTLDSFSTWNIIVNGATLSTIAGGRATDGGYWNFTNGSALNINTEAVTRGYQDDGTNRITVGSGGSFYMEEYAAIVKGAISGPGSMSIGYLVDTYYTEYTGTNVTQLTGNNSNYSGPITVTNGWTLLIGSSAVPSNDSMLGNASATNTVTLDHGILTGYSGFSGLHTILVNPGGGTIDTLGGANTTTALPYGSYANNNEEVLGSGAAQFNIGIGALNAGAGGAGPLTIQGGGNVSVAAQVLSANASAGIRVMTLGGLNLNASGLSLATPASEANRSVLVTSSLSLSGTSAAWTSKLDLGGNDMIVQNGTLTTVQNQIKQGFAGGTWQGSAGITSSAAANNPKHLTALGVIQNSSDGVDSSGSTLYPAFDGVSSSNNDVLIKYTYYGDANLSGKVDSADYTLIDNGYLGHLSGWYNGDFNYDGVVNGSDYTLIDNAFNTQGAQILSQVASPTAQIAGSVSSAVPEPTALGLIGIGVLGLLSRRKRPGHP